MQTVQPKAWLWGPLSPLGLVHAPSPLAIDQAHKCWMLAVYRIQERGPGRGHAVPRPRLRQEHRHQLRPVRLQESHAGQWLLAAFAGLAVAGHGVWLARGVTTGWWRSAWG